MLLILYKIKFCSSNLSFGFKICFVTFCWGENVHSGDESSLLCGGDFKINTSSFRLRSLTTIEEVLIYNQFLRFSQNN